MDITLWIWIIGNKKAGQKAIVHGRNDDPWGRGGARKIKVRRNAYFTACKKILTWLKSVNVKAF